MAYTALRMRRNQVRRRTRTTRHRLSLPEPQRTIPAKCRHLPVAKRSRRAACRSPMSTRQGQVISRISRPACSPALTMRRCPGRSSPNLRRRKRRPLTQLVFSGCHVRCERRGACLTCASFQRCRVVAFTSDSDVLFQHLSADDRRARRRCNRVPDHLTAPRAAPAPSAATRFGSSRHRAPARADARHADGAR